MLDQRSLIVRKGPESYRLSNWHFTADMVRDNAYCVVRSFRSDRPEFVSNTHLGARSVDYSRSFSAALVFTRAEAMRVLEAQEQMGVVGLDIVHRVMVAIAAGGKDVS